MPIFVQEHHDPGIEKGVFWFKDMSRVPVNLQLKYWIPADRRGRGLGDRHAVPRLLLAE
jgi:hypothetical protein